MKLKNEREINKKIKDLAQKIYKKHKKNLNDLCFIGIKRRGISIAQRLSKEFKKFTNFKIPVGALDISFYRDDLQMIAHSPIVRGSEIAFSLQDKIVILVDDVIYTGRTVRAALSEILDYGRPKKIELLVLVDRNHRELPIQPDYVGFKFKVKKEDLIDVFLKEEDKKEGIYLKRR
ncbi:MAG: bifunctional pyr operon transcriptional regulator/uracil phosphoribosyltransferase PyrR [candidate division WOR-3 bacterium]|nr:bifunctional pyr operon transcriptional regulator/uracil phosphoribosyltransferase PyrR [candidate division WOR-3 bacterium]MCX7836778.1 bifunctional pyr operon transcriptional regulator/uracil phosphoribosyltransferase PyrR [candidate division WOR-3 bacterium]MDW8113584.1 bifunctional pyr operon transcriptional regulator/uracil phosphoribosyltransferase PyrR [candidate division WOR-3 bacterium]